MNFGAYFSQSYEEARAKFMDAAAGLDVTSYPHPMRGRDGELLAMDVALDGAADASHLLIISSACHGVEGFCGSGIQVALLGNPAWRTALRDAGAAVLYIHALNPYGFSWWRRSTQENVDLNRNFQDFAKPLPANPDYEALDRLLIPQEWPPGMWNRLRLVAFAFRHGAKTLQTAVQSGQYTHPCGLFYGGENPTWSHLTLREVLRRYAQQRKKLTLIDLHTGLGPSGLAERMLACGDTAARERAYALWGPNLTSSKQGNSSSADVKGQMWTAICEECPQAEYTGLVLEFGTHPRLQVLDALRADQWLENRPDTPEPIRRRIKHQLRDAFYTDTDEWKRQVVEQAQLAAWQAVWGVAGPASALALRDPFARTGSNHANS